MRIYEITANLSAEAQRIKQQQQAAKLLAKNAKRSALKLKLRKTQQQLQKL